MPLFTLLNTNLRFYFQTKRFIVILPLYFFITLIFPILIIAGYISKPLDVYSFTSEGLNNFSNASALVAALFAGDAISKDFSREGFFTLTQPVKRLEIMLSRYLAGSIVTILTMFASYFIPWIIFSEAFYSSIDPNIGEIVLFAILFNLSLVAFAVLFSSLFRSSTIGIIITLLVIYLIMPAVTGILQFLGIEPWFLLTYAGSLIGNLGLKDYPPHIQTLSSQNSKFTIYNPYVWEASIIMVSYLVISLIISYFIYTRRELKEI
jgi:hypothetical protein